MSENCGKWDFNCPQFVDFTSDPLQNDDGADEWFDRGTDVAIPSLESAVPRPSSRPMPNTCSPLATPCVNLELKLKNLSNPSVKSPLVKRLRLSDASSIATTASQRVSIKRRRPSITNSLLSHAQRSIRKRLLLNRKAGFRLKQQVRKPMATICQNIDEEKQQPDEAKPFDFVASLRRYDSPVKQQPKSGVLKSTLPMPFKLTRPVKKTSDPKSPFRSIAEQVIAFEKHTPLRFRTKKANASESSAGSACSSKKEASPRRARTPRLLCMERSRPTQVLSQEEKEQLEVEEMRKLQFRAKPVNAAILQEKAKLPEFQKRPNTIVEPFNIRVVEQQAPVELPKPVEFVARPLPKSHFSSPKLPMVPLTALTYAQSPAFLLKARAQRQVQEEQRPKEEPIIQERACPNFTMEPFVPKLDHKKTEPQPFKFDERDKDRQKQKEQKIREVLEEEKRMREFRAKPLPSFEVIGLPDKQLHPPTTIQPFQLMMEERNAKKQTKWLERMVEELQKQKDQVRFKAQPCKVTVESPFIPERINRPPTNFSVVELQTEKRAKERQVFDAALKAKECEVEEIRRKREAEKDEEEQKFVASLRASAVHHAQPVHRYKEVRVEASNRSPTVPQSPKLATNKRKRSM